MRKTLLIILGILVVLIIASGVRYFLDDKNKTEDRACTMEAKLCPDGSYVGRIAPNCEFAECPKTNQGNCVNKCGDGTCQEIVCLAVGCPCAETKITCPQDCE
jgi:hypothetical protein